MQTHFRVLLLQQKNSTRAISVNVSVTNIFFLKNWEKISGGAVAPLRPQEGPPQEIMNFGKMDDTKGSEVPSRFLHL